MSSLAHCDLASIPERIVATVQYGGEEVLSTRRRLTKAAIRIAVWRKAIGEIEKGSKAFAIQAMASPEVSRAMNQAGGMTAGWQKQLGDVMERYLANMNRPSRAQTVAMAERLQYIERLLGAPCFRSNHHAQDRWMAEARNKTWLASDQLDVA